MRLAVTGSSGLIGSAFVSAARAAGHDVLRIVRSAGAAADEVAWDIGAGSIDAAALEGVEAIVHLAGENIGQRWTGSARTRIRDSRVEGTRLIADTAASLASRPALLCAGGVGYYGLHGDEALDETSAPGTGFLAEVARDWEAAADPARQAGLRTVHFRQGIVLSRHGGALERLLLPFKLGVGGRVGSGRQWWSWISLEDTIGAYLFALEAPLEGPVNLVAPQPVTNRDFVRALGRALHRPTICPLPSLAVRAAFGTMGEEMLLGGQRVLPAKLEAAGFTFRHPDLDSALAAALSA